MGENKKALIKSSPKLKKESPLNKFLGTLFATDSSNLKSYIINDIFIPLIKRGISGTVDMLLYGKSRGFNDFGSGGYYNAGKNYGTSYNSFYNNPSSKSEPHQNNPQSNNNSGYQPILFETRGDAEVILRGLRDSIQNFGIVSVSDMYEMANVPNDNYTLNHYGWTNIDGVIVVRDGGGYVINLPKPSFIK